MSLADHKTVWFQATPFRVCNECDRWVTGAFCCPDDGGPDLMIPCLHDQGYADHDPPSPTKRKGF